MKITKITLKWTGYVALVFLPLALYLAVLHVANNFHEVVPGEMYRSAQLSKGELTHYIKKYDIKSVINLRGENLQKEWYQNEVAEAKAANVEYINFKMKASRELKYEQALELIEVMRNAPKPMLIHCQGGADRTGLAAAFYIAGIKKGTEMEAELQLSILYGHIPFWFAGGYAMNKTFEEMEPHLGYYDS